MMGSWTNKKAKYSIMYIIHMNGVPISLSLATGQTRTNCNLVMGGSPYLLHSESVTFPALKNVGTHLIHLGRVE